LVGLEIDLKYCFSRCNVPLSVAGCRGRAASCFLVTEIIQTKDCFVSLRSSRNDITDDTFGIANRCSDILYSRYAERYTDP
jgi:hypothetical protein